MDQLLAPRQLYAAIYIGYIIFFSESWNQHLRHLEAVLKEIQAVGLMTNPGKYALGKRETKYLGLQVGQRQSRGH